MWRLFPSIKLEELPGAVPYQPLAFIGQGNLPTVILKLGMPLAEQASYEVVDGLLDINDPVELSPLLAIANYICKKFTYPPRTSSVSLKTLFGFGQQHVSNQALKCDRLWSDKKGNQVVAILDEGGLNRPVALLRLKSSGRMRSDPAAITAARSALLSGKLLYNVAREPLREQAPDPC